MLRSYGIKRLQNPPSYTRGLVFSIFFHISILSLVFLIPNYKRPKLVYFSPYMVSLVELAPKTQIKTEETGQDASKSKKAKKAVAVEKGVIIPKKNKKIELKKLAKVEKAIPLKEKKVSKKETKEYIESAITKEISNLRKSIKSDNEDFPIFGKGKGAPYQAGISTEILNIQYKVYYSEIWERIRRAWVLPDYGLKKDKKLETIISLKIAKDGKIVKSWVEKASGNENYDRSAINAIAKANPLPPPPDVREGEFFEVGVRFQITDL